MGADGMYRAVDRTKPWTIPDVHWIEGGKAAAIAAVGRAGIIVTGDLEAAVRSYMDEPLWGRPAACWTGAFRMPLTLTTKQP